MFYESVAVYDNVFVCKDIKYPLFDAKTTRIQYSGSAWSDGRIPYNGIWQQTKKTTRVIAVHANFTLNGTRLSV